LSVFCRPPSRSWERGVLLVLSLSFGAISLFEMRHDFCEKISKIGSLQDDVFDDDVQKTHTRRRRDR
jgi:hypothetical protein